MEHNHPHFHQGHEGKDANRLRYRCSGALCTYCLKMPAPSDDEENIIKDAGDKSAPKKSPDLKSRSEDESSSEEGSIPFDNKDPSEEASSLQNQSIATPTPAKGTLAGVQSMGNADPEFSNLQNEEEHSGDEVD